MKLALLLLLACTSKSPDSGDASVVPGPGPGTAESHPAIGTLVFVEWTTDTAVRGYVEFGETASYGSATPLEAEADTAHRAMLLGLHGGATCHFRTVTVAEDGTAIPGEAQTLALPPVPPDVPVYAPIDRVEDVAFGPWLLISTADVDAESSAAEVLDGNGQPVWYWRFEGRRVLSVRPSLDGTGIYGVVVGLDTQEGNVLARIGFDGTVTELPIPYAHHDAVELPEGGWAVLVTTYRELDGERIAGDQVVELAPDGTTRVVWDAFDHLTVQVNDGWAESQLDAPDWTHANGIAYDPDSRAYYVSMFYTENVVKIDRDSGDTLWVLGGFESDFVVDVPFGPQHAPEPFAGGLRLFDNSHDSSVGSRLVEYALDEGAGTATQTWSFTPPEPVWSIVLGDVHRRADGSAMGTFGLNGGIFFVAPDGSPAGQLGADRYLSIGQVTELAGFYPQ